MGEETTLRLDKWLWYARFFKTRTQATKLVQSGKLRLNGEIITKPHRVASVGSILTFPMAKNIRVIKIVKLAQRRGPASEAILLYEDMSPVTLKQKKDEKNKELYFEKRTIGSGRPTKKHRRQTSRLKENFFS